jgi:hypothetical protein
MMKKINLDSFGIVISYNGNSKLTASITSDMKEGVNTSKTPFNAAVDGLESIILAHFSAGIEVNSPAYLEGIETALDSLTNRFIEDDEEEENIDDSKITVVKNRRVNAIVDEEITYSVNKADWESAVETCGDEEEALSEMQTQLKLKRISYESDIDEINQEFECTVSVQ